MQQYYNKQAPSLLIVGGGLVGLATAYKALAAMPQARVTLLEKENTLAAHQSSHNSGVLHCGLYYKPGSLKARLAVSGIREITAFCRENRVPHEICGKLVVAVAHGEIPRLEGLMERGSQNGLRGLEWLTERQIREYEPCAAGMAALLVPEEGIADFCEVAKALAGKIRAMGGRIVRDARVQALDFSSGCWRAASTAGDFDAQCLINCAGLHSDRIARLAGETISMRIVPFRGEYYKLRPERASLVRNLIYPVPDPAFPFLGVHFTRMIHGGVEAGPNAVLAFAREGYSKLRISPFDALETVLFPGLWNFVLRHFKVCFGELIRSLSRRRFCRALQRLVPSLQPRDLAPGGAGVRAQAMLPNGELASDFLLHEGRRAMHVLNAPSPAATACLAIAGHILREFSETARFMQGTPSPSVPSLPEASTYAESR